MYQEPLGIGDKVPDKEMMKMVQRKKRLPTWAASSKDYQKMRTLKESVGLAIIVSSSAALRQPHVQESSQSEEQARFGGVLQDL